jgi:hypothetical protein
VLLSASIRAIRGKHFEAFKPLMSTYGMRRFVLITRPVDPFTDESRRDLQKEFFFSLQGEKLSLHLAAILL